MAERKTSSSQETEEMSGAWRELPWRKLEKHVYRVQKRIYRASQRGNTRQVEKLQKLLLKSEAARLLAVRRVTQDNQGKKTAGVDGVKSVPPKERFLMVRPLHIRRWQHRKHPLGMPTMMERAKQALVKMALEPAWEAVFEPNSYGFRPGRSCHDAIGAIFNGIRYKPKFVFDADIKGCFDHIDHEAFLKKLNAYPKLTHVIRGWLKAGVMEGLDFTPTEQGTPQGGVISPLLANVALHGLEMEITQAKHTGEKPMVVRYADDFVILHSDKAELQRAARWLEGMSLQLSPGKTRMTHTLDSHEGNVGFDFLGFHVQQHSVGKTHTGKDPHGRPLGYKTLIRPSKGAIKRHTQEIGQQVRELRNAPQEKLISELNPIIRGWCNYYRWVVCSEAFRTRDYNTLRQLMRWANARHHGKSKKWTSKKYRIRVGTQTRFGTHVKDKEGNRIPIYVRYHAETHSQDYVFKNGDLLEVDHAIPTALNGKDDISNKWVYHRHCHDEKTAEDMARIAKQKAAGINHR